MLETALAVGVGLAVAPSLQVLSRGLVKALDVGIGYARTRIRRSRRRGTNRSPAADTNRLNKDYYGAAMSGDINSYIQSNYDIIMSRARFERWNNPVIEGVVDTWRNDYIGDSGPTLQVHSEDNKYNEQLERAWSDWFKLPDVNEQISGPEMLRLSADSLMTHGRYLWGRVMDRDAKTELKTRVRIVASERLMTPFGKIHEDVVLGVKVTPSGKPVGYFIYDPPQSFLRSPSPADFRFVPVEDMIHGFYRKEPEQVTGLPWLMSVLPVAVDNKQFKRYVAEAAKAAAAMGIVVWTNNPQNGTEPFGDEEIEFEPGLYTGLPPGWQPMQVNPQQPAQNYKEYTDTQYMEIGRPYGMPRGTVTQDFKDHNFSSARLERDCYGKGINAKRNDYALTGLNRLVSWVEREAVLVGLVKQRPKSGVNLTWTWPKFASVDPLKDAQALRERLDAGVTSLVEECAAIDLDYEEVVKNRGKVKKAEEAAGVYRDEKPARRSVPQNEDDATPVKPGDDPAKSAK